MSRAYINLGGSYDCPLTGGENYTSPGEILEEMDRLGIWQTVIEFPDSANCLYRNRRLLSDLNRLPDWEKRVIPSFILDVGSLFQTGAMEEILGMLRRYRPSCISLYPKNNQYRLRAVEYTLAQAEDLDPVILINHQQLNGETAADDLVYLAGRFPRMRFVIRQVMYSGMPLVFDIMRRADNVCVDNSWLHTREAVRLVCETFGEDRLLFSLGPKSNRGAAMASIAYAHISEEAKERICHGNFISLFQAEADRRKLKEQLRVVEPQVQNSLWAPFLEGKGLSGLELYDVHTHLGPVGSSWYLYDLTMDRQVENFLSDMELFSIQKIVSSMSGRGDIIAANDEMAEAVKGHEDRFKGYLRYDPAFADQYTDEYLDSRFAGDYFIGFKTLPQYMKCDIRDESYERMFRYANERGLPILLHCWGGAKGLGSPLKCAEAASRWPQAKLILGHSGGSDAGRLESEAVAQDPRYSNVYFEFCGSFPAERCWEESLKHIDYRRVLYGTDACLHEISWELGRLLSLDIPEEQLRAILGENAKRVFGFA